MYSKNFNIMGATKIQLADIDLYCESKKFKVTNNFWGKSDFQNFINNGNQGYR